MKTIDLKQGSDEWKSWRSSGIGASDISVLMGTNPYKTKLQLWNEKCGFTSTFSNDATEHGNKYETKARELVEKNLNIKLDPICVEHDEFSFMRASLDGFNVEQNVLVEIKCPYSNSSLNGLTRERDIPPYYLDQIKYQILIACPKRAYFAIFDSISENLDLIEVSTEENSKTLTRDALMIANARDFWNLVKTGKEPEASNKDFLLIENEPELEKVVIRYKEIVKNEKELDKEKKALKDQIIEFGDDGNFMAYGIKVKRMQNPARYNIEKMRSDGIDVDKYLEKSDTIGYYKIFT